MPEPALLRKTSAVQPVKSGLNAQAMGLQPFAGCKPFRCRTNGAQSFRRQSRQRRALHEIQHRQTRGKPGRAGRGQHMVRTADIVADRFWRPVAQKDRAGMDTDLGQGLGVGDAKLQMLGREAVGQGSRFGQVADGDDGTVVGPGGGSNRAPVQRQKPPADRRSHRLTKAPVGCDQDGLRAGVVFGLGKEVKRDPVGVVARIGDDQNLGRPRDHRCPPARTPGAWRRRHRHCPAR